MQTKSSPEGSPLGRSFKKSDYDNPRPHRHGFFCAYPEPSPNFPSRSALTFPERSNPEFPKELIVAQKFEAVAVLCDHCERVRAMVRVSVRPGRHLGARLIAPLRARFRARARALVPVRRGARQFVMAPVPGTVTQDWLRRVRP